MYNLIHNDVFVNKKIAKVNIFVESVRFYMVTCVGNLGCNRQNGVFLGKKPILPKYRLKIRQSLGQKLAKVLVLIH